MFLSVNNYINYIYYIIFRVRLAQWAFLEGEGLMYVQAFKLLYLIFKFMFVYSIQNVNIIIVSFGSSNFISMHSFVV